MDVAFRDRSVRSLRREAVFFRLLALLLAAAVALLAAALGAAGLRPSQTVVVPPAVTEEFWVRRDEVSASYYSQWGHYVAMLVLNVTPDSVAHQNAMLLQQVAPRHRGAMRARLQAAAERLAAERLSTSFAVSAVHVDPARSAVAFAGTLSSYVEGREVARRDAAYRAVFEVADARLLLLEFSETSVDDVFVPRS
ncbi:MAG: type IV conjugative transfer system protein TraE [Betaproteobacteria bacterium AqS2]|uniref:Type IV conjugative transfer system protein TraE n=1 Tax=Candidatus Amphirhobacter heronislandensis TaxID=1732024 RepID=A0A930Y2M0_9GAMM|nr:type IV conjugative transfer system protein TraE [Betaproteobacteria bacterium AqS2]